jgi:sodium/potassium-transporting ATPase subunit alpha
MLRKPRRASKDHLVNAKLLLQAYGFLGMAEMLFAHWMFFTYLYMYGGINFRDTLFGKFKILYFDIGFLFMF